MDAVEILLSCVVGFSVLAFLIIAHLEEHHRKTHHEKIVGADEGAEKQILISEGFSKMTETAEGEERENPAAIPDVRESDGEKDDGFIDDWEGIERTELEKVFGEAVVFVSNEDEQICEDLKMELYGLSKIALEGPCYESQPIALKVTARSKWNAWQKLGNMSRDTAMEKYIDVLSKAVPNWKGEGTVTVSEDLTSMMRRDIYGVET